MPIIGNALTGPDDAQCDRISIQTLVGRKIVKVEESGSGLYWTIWFTGRQRKGDKKYMRVTVSARCIYDGAGNMFKEDV